MKNPGHLDGDRKIPIEQRSRSWMGNRLYELLAYIRRKEGVDPKRYPAVESDIQYDISRTLAGAEITARETAELLLPAILEGRAPGRFSRKWALLRHPMAAAILIIIFIVPIYIESRKSSNAAKAKREFETLIGHAIISKNPSIVTSINDTHIKLTISGDLIDSSDSKTIEIQHGIQPEEVKELYERYKPE